MSNNSQQFQAVFSLNGQQVKDELKRIKEEIESIDKAMQTLSKDDSETYKRQMRQYADRRKQLQEEQRQMNSMGKVVKDLMKGLDKASPNHLKQTMRDINKAIDNGAIKRGTRDWQEALRVLGKCDSELKKINAETKRFSGESSGGSFISGFKGMAAKVTAVIAAVRGVYATVSDVIRVNMDFEQQMANLSSILGKTREEIRGLQEDALRLGEATMFTASQVAGLQINLAKLGFSQVEILNSTRAILDFAAATGAALPEAAEVAGAALRAFNLDSSEMSRVVSTMAVATTQSALDFEKLRTSIAITFPIAKTFGFTIEDTVTLLGKLSDAGFDASMAATATRNILLNLANPAGKLARALGQPIHNVEELAEALMKLKERNIELAEVFDLTDKRSAGAFAQFVRISDQLVDMKEKITDADEALSDMVDKRMQTLQGSVIYLQSAWQGLELTFLNSTGAMKKVVDLLTEMIKGVTRLMSSTKDNRERDTAEAVNNAVRRSRKQWKESFNADVKEIKAQQETLEKILSENKGLETEQTRAIRDNIKDQTTQLLTDYSQKLDAYQTRAAEIRERFESIEQNIRENIRSEKNINYRLDKRIAAVVAAGVSFIAGKKTNTATEYDKLKTELIEVEVQAKKMEDYVERIGNMSKNLNEPNEYNKDPYARLRQGAEGRIKTLQEAETKAFFERKKAAEGNNEELERIEKEHAQKMHDIAVEIYSDIADKYRTLDPRFYDQYTNKVAQKNLELANKINQIETKYGRLSEQASKRKERAIEKEMRMRKKLEKQLRQGQKREESYYAHLETAITKYEGIIEDDESWRNRQRKAVNALRNEKSLLDRTYDQAYKLLLENEQNEIQLAANSAKERYRIELEYLAKRLQLNADYQKAIKANENATNATISANNKETFTKIAGYIDEALSQAGGLLDGFSGLVSARYDLMQARVEKRYDAEIEAAEKAGRNTDRIEREKQNALNDIERQRIEADYKSGVAQSFIDAAAASLKAWINPGWPWALALQAVILAQQGFTLATLKEQKDAKLAALTGYYEGGYTRGTRYREVAGVVHEGEFVANHETVRNQAVRPVLDMLDYAQKNNASPLITAEDIALAAGYHSGKYYEGGYTSASVPPSSPVVVQNDTQLLQRVYDLLDKLDRDGVRADLYASDVERSNRRRNLLLNNKSRINQ